MSPCVGGGRKSAKNGPVPEYGRSETGLKRIFFDIQERQLIFIDGRDR